MKASLKLRTASKNKSESKQSMYLGRASLVKVKNEDLLSDFIKIILEQSPNYVFMLVRQIPLHNDISDDVVLFLCIQTIIYLFAFSSVRGWYLPRHPGHIRLSLLIIALFMVLQLQDQRDEVSNPDILIVLDTFSIPSVLNKILSRSEDTAVL